MEIEKMISEEKILERIKELATIINNDYQNEELIVACILKGSTLFTCDLIKRLNMPVILDFMRTSSYGDSTISCGTVDITKDLDSDITGKNVLIVEDIIDTGRTLAEVVKNLKSRNPKSLAICTLLDKPERREVDVNVDYVGFKIDDYFAIGYGLDYMQQYRNLPYVGKVKKLGSK